MKKIILIGVLIFVLAFTMVSCQSGETVDQETADSCANLADFGSELSNFGQELTNFDSAEDAAADPAVQQAMADMDAAMAEFKAGVSGDMAADKLEAAADELEKSVRDATEGMSRKEMAAAVTEYFDIFNRECNVVNLGDPG